MVMVLLHSRSLDAVDLVPEAGYPLEAGEVGDGVDEEEAVAPAEELLAHRAVLLLAGSVQHLEGEKSRDQPKRCRPKPKERIQKAESFGRKP